jgi:multiple sugar transport system substrate-binding protein
VFADVAGLWYRRDALERAGVAPPTSWRELRAAAETVASSRAARHALVMPGGSRAGETTTYCLVALLAANGARVLEDGRVTIGSDRAAGSLRFAVSLIDDGLMPREVVAYEWDRAAHLLGSGQAAMSFGGSYEAHTLARELRVPLDRLFEHVGFAAVPRGPHGAPATATGTMVFGVLRQAAQPKLALRLLRETVAPESVARAALATGRIPARRSAVALAAAGSAFVAETAAMLDHAVARPATPLYGRVSAQLQAMLEAVLDGRRTPAEAARRAAELIGAITGLPVAGEP